MTYLLALAALALPHFDAHGDPLPAGAVARFGTVRFRVGSDQVRRAHALSPDGKYLAVEDHDGIRLWDTDTGRVARRLPWRTSQGQSPKFGLRFSPDGKRLARLAGRVVAVWDLTTGKELFDIDYKVEGEFKAIAFVPGKDQLYVTADQRPQAWTLDARTGRVLRTTEFEGKHWALEPAGSFVLDHVSTAWILFDPNTGKEKVRFLSGYDRGQSFVLAADGNRAWIADADGLLHQFNAATGDRVVVTGPAPGWRPGAGPVTAALGPDGGVLYWANGGGAVYRYDVKGDRWLDPIPDVRRGTLLTHPDGKRLLVIGQDGVLRRYDVATRKELPGSDGFEGRVVAYPSPDGKRVAVVSGEEPARLDVFDRAGRFRWADRPPAFGHFPLWSPDGRRLAVVEERVIRLLDSESGKGVRVLGRPVGIAAFRGPAAFAAGSDRLVATLNWGMGGVTFDTSTGDQVSLWNPGVAGASGWSPDGRTLLYASEEGIRLFDAAVGQFRTLWIDRPDGDEHNLAGSPGFTPDGSYLFTWELERPREAWRPRGIALVLRDPRTGAQRAVHELGLSPGFQWAVSPDGLWLAIGTASGKVDLIDVATGHGLGRWEGHRDGITSVHFVGPGKVLTASADLTALVWAARPKAGPTAPAWEGLGGKDGNQAWKAVWALAADPNGPDLLRSKIAVVAAPRSDQVNRWVAELGADRYPVREAATRALQDLGRLAEPAMKAAREQTTSEEVRTRLDALLGKITAERTPAELVRARAVAAMELAGTPAARKLLVEWAAGAPGARLTTDAKAALGRLTDQ
jgi:WD40 repeat protein